MSARAKILTRLVQHCLLSIALSNITRSTETTLTAWKRYADTRSETELTKAQTCQALYALYALGSEPDFFGLDT